MNENNQSSNTAPVQSSTPEQPPVAPPQIKPKFKLPVLISTIIFLIIVGILSAIYFYIFRPPFLSKEICEIKTGQKCYQNWCQTEEGNIPNGYDCKFGWYPEDKLSTSPTSPSTTPNPTQDEASWKTYTSTLYGYSLEHPPDWEFKLFSEKYPGRGIGIKDYTVFENKPLTSNDQGANDFERGRVYGEIMTMVTGEICGKDCETLSESEFFNLNHRIWKTGDIGGGGPGTTVEKVYEANVGGKRAMVKLSRPTINYEGAKTTDRTLSYYIYLGNKTNNNKSHKVVLVSLNYSISYNDHESFLKTFDQVLSTFTFVDSK